MVEDDGPFTRQVADELLASPRLEAKESARAEAAEAASRTPAGGRGRAAGGFERLKDWQPGSTGERPELRILHHPNAGAERQWAEGVVTEVVMQRLAREAFGAS